MNESPLLIPYDLNFVQNWQNILVKKSKENSKIQAPKNKQIPMKNLRKKNSPQGRKGAAAYLLKIQKAGAI